MRSIGRMLRKNDGQILIEPIGFFSAEWFSKKYHTPVVLVVRHPASFVSSLKKLNWGFDFNCLLTQKELMECFNKAKSVETALRLALGSTNGGR